MWATLIGIAHRLSFMDPMFETCVSSVRYFYIILDSAVFWVPSINSYASNLLFSEW
jgi:hypothetical protein